MGLYAGYRQEGLLENSRSANLLNRLIADVRNQSLSGCPSASGAFILVTVSRCTLPETKRRRPGLRLFVVSWVNGPHTTRSSSCSLTRGSRLRASLARLTCLVDCATSSTSGLML
jgi:hypothetical protein